MLIAQISTIFIHIFVLHGK